MKTKDELLTVYRDDNGDDEYFLEVFIDIRDQLARIADHLEKRDVVSLDESVGTTAA